MIVKYVLESFVIKKVVIQLNNLRIQFQLSFFFFPGQQAAGESVGLMVGSSHTAQHSLNSV
jgi:hypothetical protein